MDLFVRKNNGEKEDFSFEKIYQSLQRVGVPRSLANSAVKEIKKKVYPGIKTKEIAHLISEYFKEKNLGYALKFNLKEGMKKLGPTGFPFEKYIGEIFAVKGFEVKLNQIIRGCCSNYEIDFTAKKGALFYIGECKFRKLFKGKVHLDVALANYARFLDIKKEIERKRELKGLKVKSILVTNRKFTTKAINYSKCVGVDLLGWRYPSDKGLEFLIEEEKLYPITILPSLDRYTSRLFISRRITLIKDLLDINLVLLSKETGVELKQLKSLQMEAKVLLSLKGRSKK